MSDDFNFDHVANIMGSGNAKQWQEAWWEAKKRGETGTKEFWKKFHRANGRGGPFVTGIMEVDAALHEFENATRKRLFVAASKKICKKTRQDAIAAVPKKSGALQRAIKVTALRRHRKQRFVDRGKPTKIGASVTINHNQFINNEFYGVFVEKGTNQRVTKLGESRGEIPYPKFAFLRPSLLKNQEYAKNNLVQAVRDAISDAARRAQNKIIKSLLPGAKAVNE